MILARKKRDRLGDGVGRGGGKRNTKNDKYEGCMPTKGLPSLTRKNSRRVRAVGVYIPFTKETR